MSEQYEHFHQMGRKHCDMGINRAGDVEVAFGADEFKAYQAGYAKRYEEEQQLTNQCEGQENGNN